MAKSFFNNLHAPSQNAAARPHMQKKIPGAKNPGDSSKKSGFN